MAKHLGLDSSATHFLPSLHFLSAHPARAVCSTLPSPPPPLFFSSLRAPLLLPRWLISPSAPCWLDEPPPGLSLWTLRRGCGGRGLHLYINIYIYIFFFFTIVVSITIINIIAMKCSKEAELRHWQWGRGQTAARHSSSLPSCPLVSPAPFSTDFVTPATSVAARPPPHLVHLLSS